MRKDGVAPGPWRSGPGGQLLLQEWPSAAAIYNITNKLLDMNFRIFLVQLLSLFFGLVYPAYGSVAAIESNTGEDDTHWLIYWLIFSILTIVENVAWPALKWVPLYGELKVAVLAWLVLPATKGALWVYEALLGPALMRARADLSKSPAFQQAIAKLDRGTKQAPKVRNETDNAAELSKRRSALGAVLKDVNTAFESDLRHIESITQPKQRQDAESAFDKCLSRLSKVAAAREKGNSGSLFGKAA